MEMMRTPATLVTLVALFVAGAAGALPAWGEENVSAAGLATGGKVPRPRPITPPTPEAIEDSILRGIDFLIHRQNRDGSWGSARNTKQLNITTPVPGGHHGLRAAVTSLCVAAIIESGDQREATQETLRRAEAWMIEEVPRVRRGSTGVIYNVWAHAYSIEALILMHDRLPDDKERQEQMKELIRGQVDRLRRYSYLMGGWGYYEIQYGMQRPAGRSNSFTTATCLIALKKAMDLGIEVPEKIIKPAVREVKRQRRPDFGYLYSSGFVTRTGHEINQPGGSLARSQVCNLAMRMYGDEKVTDQVMIDWLDRLIVRNGWLSISRKRPIPHESWYRVAGYFFYYGHYYAAGCIAELPAEEQPRLKGHLADIIIKLQESTGCWWDYPLYDYHQQYGTALAIRTLVGCRPDAAEATE
ncbi:MAG: hypothetical protein DWQ31_02580 [Planctomycetota bacterium]|nr:MAG: hypothetical protein DWQ31_02580 [Planctomycetota bacterium]REJ95773.1 MAG: hypothetical protein DWQ35_05830 [Planctomycetota bacterium]REK25348.1 MAG: hypothetical protein DWQ42_11525 [Planctomycetota bacterium]REK43483.1 MAG: hypothetical protein DWQ46_11270 [Planctomycetota bacterium]